LNMLGLKEIKLPHIRREDKLPFIPLESELDALISYARMKTCAFLALIMAYFSLTAHIGEPHIVDVNFRRLEDCVEEGEKPLLKALIRIKAKNREFDLEQIYNENPSMFERERLLEGLYE